MQVPPPVPETPGPTYRPDSPRRRRTSHLGPHGRHRGTAIRNPPQHEFRFSFPTNPPASALTTAGTLVDQAAAPGRQHYVLVVTSGQQRSRPARTMIDVPEPAPLAAPQTLLARAMPGEIELEWDSPRHRHRATIRRLSPQSEPDDNREAHPRADRDHALSRRMGRADHDLCLPRGGRRSPRPHEPAVGHRRDHTMPASRHPVFTATFLDKAEAPAGRQLGASRPLAWNGQSG